jgi:hypothetical protein
MAHERENSTARIALNVCESSRASATASSFRWTARSGKPRYQSVYAEKLRHATPGS